MPQTRAVITFHSHYFYDSYNSSYGHYGHDSYYSYYAITWIV